MAEAVGKFTESRKTNKIFCDSRLLCYHP